jgi:hypothetical protein
MSPITVREYHARVWGNLIVENRGGAIAATSLKLAMAAR